MIVGARLQTKLGVASCSLTIQIVIDQVFHLEHDYIIKYKNVLILASSLAKLSLTRRYFGSGGRGIIVKHKTKM